MIPTWYSGYNEKVLSAGVFHYEQAIELKKFCNVALYYPFDEDLSYGFIKSNENDLLTFRSKPKGNKITKYLKWIKDFREVNKCFKPDILHAHVGSAAGFLAIIFGKIYKIPVVITEHNPLELMNLKNSRYYKRNLYVYRNSDANICVSDDLKMKLEHYYKGIKFSTIFNGVISPNVISNQSKYAYKEFINCGIAASFYDKEIKGLQYLLPAIKKIRDNNKCNIMLHICGGGKYLEYYKSFAKQIGIENNCKFYDQCNKNEVYLIISEMDFCISSSIFESAGIFVQESMLLGKPLVVTNSGGANSLVTESTAIIVEKESVEALVEGIEEIIDKLPFFDSCSIIDYAKNRFGMNKILKEYMDLYKSILEKDK